MDRAGFTAPTRQDELDHTYQLSLADLKYYLDHDLREYIIQIICPRCASVWARMRNPALKT